MHLHSPFSVLNNQFGDPESDKTRIDYFENIETVSFENQISAIGITDYFSIEGYKKDGSFESLIFSNIEIRADSIVYGEKERIDRGGRRLNLHVIFSSDVDPKEIEKNFLHDLDFVSNEDSFGETKIMKLKRGNLRYLAKKRGSRGG